MTWPKSSIVDLVEAGVKSSLKMSKIADLKIPVYFQACSFSAADCGNSVCSWFTFSLMVSFPRLGHFPMKEISRTQPH